MTNTFFGLTIGSSGLFASNAAINTTAHNIYYVKIYKMAYKNKINKDNNKPIKICHLL